LLHPHNFKQFKTFTLDPLIRHYFAFATAGVRVTIDRLRPIVVAIVPILAYGTFSGAESHNAGGFKLDFIAWHDVPLD
jgi:hypothetical protein